MQLRPEYQTIRLDPHFPVKSSKMHSNNHSALIYCHWHSEIEIIYVDKGNVSMGIDNHVFELNQGDICLINPNQVHYGTAKQGTDSSIHYIVLSYSMLSLDTNNPIYHKYIEPLSNGRLLLPSVIPHMDPDKKDTPIWQKQCHSVIQTLLDYGIKQFEGREIGIQSAFLMLLSTLYRFDRFVEASKMKKNALSTRELAILDYVEGHFTEHLRIPDLASRFMVSEDYFYKIFKKITGQTPINFIQQLRIQYAKQLLKTTELSISDIGYQVGFDSTSYFSKTYKKLTGMPPRAYRKTN